MSSVPGTVLGAGDREEIKRQPLSALPRGHILVGETDGDKEMRERGGEFGGGGPHGDSDTEAGIGRSSEAESRDLWENKAEALECASFGQVVFIIAPSLASSA